MVLSLFLHTFSTFLKLCSAHDPYLLRVVPAIGRLLRNLSFKMNSKTRLIINIIKLLCVFPIILYIFFAVYVWANININTNKAKHFKNFLFTLYLCKICAHCFYLGSSVTLKYCIFTMKRGILQCMYLSLNSLLPLAPLTIEALTFI